MVYLDKMQITYFGHSAFKLRGRDISCITDPFSVGALGYLMPKVEADIVTISHHHPDHDDLTRVKGQAFVIDGPGEYEIKGVSIWGLPSFHDEDKKIKNNIYLIQMDGVRVCHLGDLGCFLPQNQLEELNGIDVLLVKVGDERFLSVGQTIKLVNQIEPSIVIPMHYRTEKMDEEKWAALATLEDFLKEYGQEGEREEKLILNKGDLPEETKLVILERMG